MFWYFTFSLVFQVCHGIPQLSSRLSWYFTFVKKMWNTTSSTRIFSAFLVTKDRYQNENVIFFFCFRQIKRLFPSQYLPPASMTSVVIPHESPSSSIHWQALNFPSCPSRWVEEIPYCVRCYGNKIKPLLSCRKNRTLIPHFQKRRHAASSSVREIDILIRIIKSYVFLLIIGKDALCSVASTFSSHSTPTNHAPSNIIKKR